MQVSPCGSRRMRSSGYSTSAAMVATRASNAFAGKSPSCPRTRSPNSARYVTVPEPAPPAAPASPGRLRLLASSARCRSALLQFLVVAGPAGRDDRQPPGVQEPLQLPAGDRITLGVYGLVVLAEELGAFPLGQVAENNRRIIRVVNLGRLGGHATKLLPGPGPE